MSIDQNNSPVISSFNLQPKNHAEMIKVPDNLQNLLNSSIIPLVLPKKKENIYISNIPSNTDKKDSVSVPSLQNLKHQEIPYSIQSTPDIKSNVLKLKLPEPTKESISTKHQNLSEPIPIVRNEPQSSFVIKPNISQGKYSRIRGIVNHKKPSLFAKYNAARLIPISAKPPVKKTPEEHNIIIHRGIIKPTIEKYVENEKEKEKEKEKNIDNSLVQQSKKLPAPLLTTYSFIKTHSIKLNPPSIIQKIETNILHHEKPTIDQPIIPVRKIQKIPEPEPITTKSPISSAKSHDVKRPDPTDIDPIITQEKKEVDVPSVVKQDVVPQDNVPQTNKLDKKQLVSVIIPTYNVERYISRAIESLLQQTYKHIEIIIVDDASTDRTPKVIEYYVKKYPEKVKMLQNKKNMGTYISINRGIQLSEGNYITLLGSDDIFIPYKIQIQVAYLQRNSKYMASFCLYERVHFKTGEVTIQRMGESTIMFRRKILNEIGYYDSVRYGADSEYMSRIQAVYGSAAMSFINKVLYRALWRPGSLTTTKTTKIGSTTRAIYSKNFKRWHRQQKKLYIPFPQQKREFEAPYEMYQ